MNVTFTRGLSNSEELASDEACECWIATATSPDIMIFRTWATPCYSVRGEGDTLTEALQDMLLNCWEEGGRWSELIDMLDAEFGGQEWWLEVKAMDAAA